MGTIDLLRPGQRAVGFEHSSSEVLALAEAFNEMLERLEDERRSTSGLVLAGQEAERLRIARELHDDLGQTLTAVALRAEHASAHAGKERAELAELAEVVQQSLQDVRRISTELRPAALDQLGLVNGLISLCARVDEQSALRVHRKLGGPIPEMAPDVELAIYRIVQEALTNVMRHSQATDATVSLRVTDEELVLSVSDNGGGLPEHVIEGGGLTGMRERAMLIGPPVDPGRRQELQFGQSLLNVAHRARLGRGAAGMSHVRVGDGDGGERRRDATDPERARLREHPTHSRHAVSCRFTLTLLTVVSRPGRANGRDTHDPQGRPSS